MSAPTTTLAHALAGLDGGADPWPVITAHPGYDAVSTARITRDMDEDTAPRIAALRDGTVLWWADTTDPGGWEPNGLVGDWLATAAGLAADLDPADDGEV